MTGQEKTPSTAGMDMIGGLALIAITAGAAWEFGIGWALLTFGGLLGGVYILLEIILIPRRRPDRR